MLHFKAAVSLDFFCHENLPKFTVATYCSELWMVANSDINMGMKMRLHRSVILNPLHVLYDPQSLNI